MVERVYKNVSYRLEPGIVRVDNNIVLDRMIRKNFRACRHLSEDIRQEYLKIYEKELKITEKSLAVEIYLHYKCHIWFTRLQKRFKKSRILKRLLRSTVVIDSGEKDVDNNRFIWDLLAVFVR